MLELQSWADVVHCSHCARWLLISESDLVRVGQYREFGAVVPLVQIACSSCGQEHRYQGTLPDGFAARTAPARRPEETPPGQYITCEVLIAERMADAKDCCKACHEDLEHDHDGHPETTLADGRKAMVCCGQYRKILEARHARGSS